MLAFLLSHQSLIRFVIVQCDNLPADIHLMISHRSGIRLQQFRLLRWDPFTSRHPVVMGSIRLYPLHFYYLFLPTVPGGTFGRLLPCSILGGEVETALFSSYMWSHWWPRSDSIYTINHLQQRLWMVMIQKVDILLSLQTGYKRKAAMSYSTHRSSRLWKVHKYAVGLVCIFRKGEVTEVIVWNVRF